MLSYIPSTPDIKDFKYYKVANITQDVEPIEIDYRPLLPPCFDQMHRGVCVSEGAIGVKAFQEIQEGDYPDDGLSVAHLYCEIKRLEGNTNEGAMPKSAMQILKNIGVCKESTMPFHLLSDLPEGQLPKIPSNVYEEASKYKIKKFAQICSPFDISRKHLLNIIRATLRNEGVFTLALLIYDNFIPDIDGFLPLPQGDIKGGHQTAIIGDLPNIKCPDGSLGALILRNSWGTSWGCLNGYAYLPYSWLTYMVNIENINMWAILEAWTACDMSYS